MIKRLTPLIVSLAAGVALAGCGSTPDRPPPAAASPPPGSVVIHAAGTDYAAPIYQELGNLVQRRGLTLNYQLLGTPRLAPGPHPSSVPLVASSSSQSLGADPLLHSETYVPVAFGALAIVYDLPGIRGLRLSAAALAAIFSGQVVHWNAGVIARCNPGLLLPATPITVAHLSTSSVLTQLLTSYLAAGSRRWRRTLGSGARINWPTGTSVSDETAMIGLATGTPGVIGYASQATALQDKLVVAKLRNPAGTYVAPTLTATRAVGMQPHAPGQLSLSTIDAPGLATYPIAAEAYAMTFTDLCASGFSPAESLGVQRLLGFLIGSAGQTLVARFSFAPLPRGLRASALDAVRQLSCASQPLSS